MGAEGNEVDNAKYMSQRCAMCFRAQMRLKPTNIMLINNDRSTHKYIASRSLAHDSLYVTSFGIPVLNTKWGIILFD